jgi:hypothetical protein
VHLKLTLVERVAVKEDGKAAGRFGLKGEAVMRLCYAT